MLETYPDDILKRLQEEELDILLVLDELCRKHELTYFIDGGTLLGAVRHGGFIPWDDDIDIGLPHEDYLRFLEIAARELPAGYELCTPRTTPQQSATWAKVVKKGTRFMDGPAVEAGYEQGIFVDVFDFIAFEKDPKRRQRQIKRLVTWQRISYINKIAHPHIPADTPLKPLVRLGLRAAHEIVSRCVPDEFIIDRFERALRSEEPGDLWMDAAYATRELVATDLLFPTQPIAFCGKTVMGPHDPDAYLTSLYGDYRQLPPEDKRHNHTPEILDFGDGINVMDQ